MTSNNPGNDSTGNLLPGNLSSSSSLASQKNNYHTIVIREVYDGINSQERFEFELECALEEKADYIVIEPTKLGEETSRWIRVGNCLHKTAVISGLASAIVPHFLPETNGYLSILARLPTSVLSIGCATLYGISWQFDPCCKYQVTVNSRELSKLNIKNLTNASPVVLVRRDDRYRKGLHNTISFVAGVLMLRTVQQIWSS